jgi:outer membrane protein OmpA-like peptidoglycan-associated protein
MPDPANAQDNGDPISPNQPAVAPPRRHTWLKLLAGLVVLALLWTGVLGLWLPGWVRPKAEAAATQALGTPVRIGQLAVQPWTLNVTADDIAIGPQGHEILKLQQAQAQLSLASVWRFAPVLRRVTLTRPELWVERQQTERFNFTPILEHMAARKQPEPADAAPARFAIYNIRLTDGLVRYGDRVLEQTHRIEAINIGVPFISSLPADEDVDVQPLVEARVNGSPLRVDGRTLPFKEGLHSEIDVQWRDVDLPKWASAVRPLLPPEAQADVTSGRLAASLKIVFEERKAPAVPRVAITGGVDVSDLQLAVPAAGLQTRWTALKVAGIDSLPLERQARLGSITLEGLRVGVRPPTTTTARTPSITNSGVKTDAQAKPPRAGTPSSGESGTTAPKAAAAPPAAWRWRLDQLRVNAEAIDVQPPRADPLPTLGPVHITLSGLTSGADSAPAKLHLDAADPHGMTLSIDGGVQAQPARATLHLKLAELQAAPWLKALDKLLTLPVQITQGALSGQTRLEADAQAIVLSQGQLGLKDLKAQASAKGVKDGVSLATLDAQGLQARLRLPTADQAGGLDALSLATLTLDKLDARATRDAQGRWLLMPPTQDAPPASKPGAPVNASTPLPQVAVAELRCTQCAVAVSDQSVQPPAQVTLAQTDLILRQASTDLGQFLRFAVNTRAQGKGQIRLSGEVRPQPLSLRGKLGITQLDLRAVQPYIDPHVNIELAQAVASMEGSFTVNLPLDNDVSKLDARYQGQASLGDVRVQDSVNQADFLRWKLLSAKGLDIAWKNQALDADLGRIALQDFYGRVIINPNGRLNLADITDRSAGQEAKSLTTPQETSGTPGTPKTVEPLGGTTTAPIAPKAEAAASGPASMASAASTPQSSNLRWQHITLAKGRVDFTDNFVKPNYSARLTRVEGDISAVASSKPEPAQVKISGAVDDGAPLEITGQLHPLGPRLYTDIRGSAKGIELTRLSPYAGRYAGYAIEKGTLSLTVHYKVDKGQLEAQNQIFLDQLTFGDKVDSPDATRLPVQLAISLLKNSRGEIDISLPVSGSLDDPQFSVGGIIWKVIANLLTRAITAPFSLLMGGGDSNELGTVGFDPGSAELSDNARERLDTLVSKLKDKPSLKLEATGRADPAVDADGLRERYVRGLMRAAKAKATGQPLPDVRIGDDERTQWLTAAYKAADIQKPRNLIGLAKTLPPAEMEALLKASAPADDTALKVLADRRGDRVKAYLADRLSPERVLLTASKLGRNGLPEDDKASGARVQFAIH